MGRYGVQSRGDDTCPGESCSDHGVVACPVHKQGGFEGEGIVVDRGVSRGAEGAVDGGPYGVQWQAWRHPVPAQCQSGCSSARHDASGRGWPHMTDIDGVVLPPA
jgi:hypothetical protein